MTSSVDINSTTFRLIVSPDAATQNIFSSGGTAMAWIRADDAGSFGVGRIFNKTSGTSTDPSSGWLFATRTGTTSSDLDLGFFREWSGSSSTPNWRVDDVLTTANWYYVGVTYSDSSTSNDPTFWVNGVSQGSGTETNAPSGSAVSDATDTLYFGNSNGQDRAFDGRLCCLQMWTRVLSENEIIESMFKPGSIRVGLAGYWPCIGADSPARDLSGNGNNATVVAQTSTLGPPIRLY